MLVKQKYASNLTDRQWETIKNLLPKLKTGRRKPKWRALWAKLFIFHFWWKLNKTPTATGSIAFDIPIGHPHFDLAGRRRDSPHAVCRWPVLRSVGQPDGWGELLIVSD